MAVLATLLIGSLALQGRPWKIRITDENEPGIPFVFAGKVVDSSGAPLEGVKVHVYQTDASGLYHKPGQDGFRLKGDMWTNREGRFEFRTVRPGPYPGAKFGEHFHFEVSGGGLPDSFAYVEFRDDRPTHRFIVGAGKKGGSATYSTDFDWKPDPVTKGQRADVVFKFSR